jgi:aspartate/methionine/tyrosine aminotransferase
VDPTPAFVQSALIASSNSPGYPLTIGSPELRDAMRAWATDVVGVTGEFDLLPSIGSKEVVANLPAQLEVKNLLYPEIAYPTYLVGGIMAGAHNRTVGHDSAQWPNADLVWINSPSNPTGRISSGSELRAIIEYSRKTGAIIASDECYLNFPGRLDAEPPQSILRIANGDNRNLLALYSLSKRYNLAGYRGGLIIGDPALIARLKEVRKPSCNCRNRNRSCHVILVYRFWIQCGIIHGRCRNLTPKTTVLQ